MILECCLLLLVSSDFDMLFILLLSYFAKTFIFIYYRVILECCLLLLLRYFGKLFSYGYYVLFLRVYNPFFCENREISYNTVPQDASQTLIPFYFFNNKVSKLIQRIIVRNLRTHISRF